MKTNWYQSIALKKLYNFVFGCKSVDQSVLPQMGLK